MKNKNRHIFVLIVREQDQNKNTASFNRDEAVEKMVKNLFPCIVIKPSSHNLYSKSNLKNIICRKLSFYWSLSRIFSISRNRSNSYIIFLRSLDPLAALATWIIAKPLGMKLAIERNEYPSIIIKSSKFFKKWFYSRCVLSWHYRLFDIIFLMTDDLISFYSNYTKRNACIQKLPMTVDTDRFNFKPIKSCNPYIFYGGSLSEKKDGVESLIKAFKIVLKKHHELELIIAGASKNGDQEDKLKNLIKDMSLSGHVKLLGSVARHDIPELINSAKILVLPRPDSLQARGGFPTKLGEYLASGNPVIVTRVGEIPRFLSEKEVFFISATNIINDLVQRIDFILEHYAHSLEIAANGKSVAEICFSLNSNQIYIENAFINWGVDCK